VDEVCSERFSSFRRAGPLEISCHRGVRRRPRQQADEREGVHGIRAITTGSYFVDVFFEFKRPPKRYWRCRGRHSCRAGSDGSQSASKLINFHRLKSRGQSRGRHGSYGRLIKPSNFREGTKYPLLCTCMAAGLQEILNEWQPPDWATGARERGYWCGS